MANLESNPSSWEYHMTLRDGLFYVHPPEVGGPFRSLGEASATINYYPTWASAIRRIMTEYYYFALKKGRFHAHPDGVGGPFKLLEDAMDAVRRHREFEQEEEEKTHRIHQFLEELDPAVYIQRIKSVIEMIQRGIIRDTESRKPVTRRWAEDVKVSWEPGKCDPAISREAGRFERIVAKKEAIENGMKWMQSEALQAFETIKESAGYQGLKYEFVKLDQQCLIHDTFSKSYHHYNFTMKKNSSKKHWDYQLFFAEVKPTEDGRKRYFCCPLQSDENGHFFGCRNAGVDLRHPTSGRYEKGNQDSGFPFDSDSGSDD